MHSSWPGRGLPVSGSRPGPGSECTGPRPFLGAQREAVFLKVGRPKCYPWGGSAGRPGLAPAWGWGGAGGRTRPRSVRLSPEKGHSRARGGGVFGPPRWPAVPVQPPGRDSCGRSVPGGVVAVGASPSEAKLGGWTGGSGGAGLSTLTRTGGRLGRRPGGSAGGTVRRRPGAHPRRARGASWGRHP